MDTLHFDDYEDFAYAVVEEYEKVKLHDDLDSIDIVGKYEDIKEVMAELVRFGYDITSVDGFGNAYMNNYDDEYVLSVYDDGVWCERAKKDYGYLIVEAEVVYLLDDCNSKVVPKVEAKETYIVEIGDECDCDCENCECMSDTDNTYVHLSDGDDGNTHGFTASKSDGDSYMSYSYYSSDGLSHDDIQNMLKTFGF